MTDHEKQANAAPPWAWLFVASLASGIATGLLLDWIRAAISRRQATLAAGEEDL